MFIRNVIDLQGFQFQRFLNRGSFRLKVKEYGPFNLPSSTRNQTQAHGLLVETPQKIAEAKMHYTEANGFRELWNEEIKDLLVADALLLRFKDNKKELDPRFFDTAEKAEFDKADKKEWSQWLSNKVVRFLTPQEASRVPKNKISRAPMRVVRVNKSTERLAPLIAKSRLIIPGHLDPEIRLLSN